MKLLVATLAAVPVLFGGWFKSCVEPRNPKAAQSDPSWASRESDLAWRWLSLQLVSELQARHAELRADLMGSIRELPPGTIDPPESHQGELAVQGTYGQLPEVVVDQDAGAIFPAPINKPQRYSWFQIAYGAQDALAQADRFAKGFAQWRELSAHERARQATALASGWDSLEGRVVGLARQVRYLESWVPQLTRQWTDSHERPPQYMLTAAIQQGDPRLMDALREVLRPTRVIKRAFLPESLGDEHGTEVVTLPIATDVTDRKFLAEIDGALATHWSQSTWAREQSATFRIEWTRVPRDDAFARGKITLDQHLAKFPQDRAALTTGGLTTYVRGQALVLGPGKITPRTLAHELGHLMGFADCYLRTLSGQGLLGTAVLEWDNPLYPDDIMCDNAVGAARAEAW